MRLSEPFSLFQEVVIMTRNPISLSLRVGEQPKQIGWWRFGLIREQDEVHPQLRNFIVTLSYKNDPLQQKFRFVVDQMTKTEWALFYDDVGSLLATSVAITSDDEIVLDDCNLALDIARNAFKRLPQLQEAA
jgi:hypothetical protein